MGTRGRDGAGQNEDAAQVSADARRNGKLIRIAVEINSDGEWSCAGWSQEGGGAIDDDELRAAARDAGFEGSHPVWVEVDVPLPDPTVPVVRGEVTGG